MPDNATYTHNKSMDEHKHQWWDHTVAHNSALRSAIPQYDKLEFAHGLGRQWAMVLFDLDKFYDTIGVTLLIQEALHHPARVAYKLAIIYLPQHLRFRVKVISIS